MRGSRRIQRSSRSDRSSADDEDEEEPLCESRRFYHYRHLDGGSADGPDVTGDGE
jgi:hypothetical protein